MNETLGLVLVGVLLVNFLMLGTSRLNAAIRFAGLQGVLLGAALFVAHGQTNARVLLLALATVALKGIAIPAILLRAVRNVSIRLLRWCWVRSRPASRWYSRGRSRSRASRLRH